MKNKNDKELKKKYNKAQLKLFFRDSDGINEDQDFPEDEIDHSGDDCIENPINDIIQNSQLLDEKTVENSQNSQIPYETPAIAINGWDKLPNEIFKKILIQAIKSFNHVCETYNNILNFRFPIPNYLNKGENVASLCLYQTQ